MYVLPIFSTVQFFTKERTMVDSISITGLFYYPIKSCKGLQLSHAELDERGIKGDRSFMIVTPEGRFLTQRELPTMARIEPHLDVIAQTMRLTASTMETLTIATTRISTPTTLMFTEVWGDECRSVVQDPHANEWLSSFLGRECRLVTMEQGFKRTVDQEFAICPSDHTGFADGFPMLLISEASLESLNGRLIERGSEAVPMNRFRPNIVVKGAEAFAEDAWSAFSINGVPMHGVKPCGRCIITTIDQEQGVKTGAEPVATLKMFRKSEDGNKILFGQNVIHSAQGTISVGDVLRV
jgi:uncharacterized protein